MLTGPSSNGPRMHPYFFRARFLLKCHQHSLEFEKHDSQNLADPLQRVHQNSGNVLCKRCLNIYRNIWQPLPHF